MIKRHVCENLWKKLSSYGKIVFLSGPRQSGKTTFSKNIAKSFANSDYFNWDSLSDKKRFSKNPAFFQELDRKDNSKPLIIFDEIHKYKKWKSYLKGIYDEFSDDYSILITGSGRLDIGQKGGDALSGRYAQMNMFPFTISELSESAGNIDSFIASPLKNVNLAKNTGMEHLWDQLFNFGGFPEPFIKKDKEFLNIWSDSYLKQLVRDDIRSVIDLKNADSMELLVSMLPSKIGSPISMNNIAEDLHVSFETVKNWLKILDSFYVTFSLSSWSKKIARAILKSKKIYLFNYTEINDEALRYENMVALDLYSTIIRWRQNGKGDYGLFYIRNKEKEEVDFVITKDNEPKILVEAKLNDTEPSKSLTYFQKTLKVPAVQLVNKKGVSRLIKNDYGSQLIVSAHLWLARLP
jgi:hypothetical protein